MFGLQGSQLAIRLNLTPRRERRQIQTDMCKRKLERNPHACSRKSKLFARWSKTPEDAASRGRRM